MKAVVGRGLGNAVKTYLDIKAKRKGPANEPLDAIACAYRFRLWTYWTDFDKDPSGHTMGYDIHTFTFVVKAAPQQ